LREIRTADLDAIAAQIAGAIAGGRAPSPVEARFLLREYIATGRDDVRDALGLALAHALADAGPGADDTANDGMRIADRAALLMLFVEAVAIADDERVIAAAGDLAGALRAAWPIDLARAGLAAAARSVDACLHASALFASAGIVQPAIDELERIVGATYRPGEGLGAAPSAAYACAASALLTAFEITGRLPYSMLAEELMASPHRSDDCETARVLCRLAALHDNEEYRAAAILAPGADYRADAARILEDYAPHVRAAEAADAALYGIALRELISLR